MHLSSDPSLASHLPLNCNKKKQGWASRSHLPECSFPSYFAHGGRVRVGECTSLPSLSFFLCSFFHSLAFFILPSFFPSFSIRSSFPPLFGPLVTCPPPFATLHVHPPSFHPSLLFSVPPHISSDPPFLLPSPFLQLLLHLSNSRSSPARTPTTPHVLLLTTLTTKYLYPLHSLSTLHLHNHIILLLLLRQL